MHRSRQSPRSIVLYYHRAATPLCDPFQLAVDPDRLSEHLAVLTEFAEVVPLARLIDGRSKRRTESRVAVTFDDGYADNYLEAAPRLVAAGVPATMFVTSSVIQAGPELWWDRLGHLFLDVVPTNRHVTLTVDHAPLTLDLGSEAARLRGMAAVRTRLFRRPTSMIDDTIGRLAAALEVPEPLPCADHRMLTPEQLRLLAQVPGVTVGSHTVTHPTMAALSDQDQARELAESRADLEAVTGERIDSFAYPFGERTSYDRRTVALLRRLGYASAVTTDHGPVGWWTSPLRVARYRVENWTGEQFRGALRSWLALL